MHLLIYIDIALFIFIAFFIGYDLFFTLASFFRRRHRKHRSIQLQKFAVIFAAYKEDQVIQESVERILLQDYPADKYRVIVVSDHMREETNQALAKLPIELLTPDFKHSMKHKSITYALEYLKEGIDKVVILDADNLTDTDFLTRVNDITQDNIALQAHRTLKNDNTPIAVWDGISEEINNTIFRKGRVNVGISSSLIGSGMVFDFGWLKSHMPQCGTFAEDKELEIYLATENIFVDYAEDILVYDEKTSRQEVMAKIPLVPRPTAGVLIDHTPSRPPYPQLELYGQGGPMVPAPENIKTDHPVPPRLGMEPHGFPACPEMVWANTGQHLDVYAGYPPEDAYPEALHEPVEAPFSLLRLDKRIYSLLAPGEGEGHQLPEYSS